MMTAYLDWEMAKSVSCLNSNDKKNQPTPKPPRFTLCAPSSEGLIPRPMKIMGVFLINFIDNTWSDLWNVSKYQVSFCFQIHSLDVKLVSSGGLLSCCQNPNYMILVKTKLSRMNLWLKLWCKKQILLGKTKIFSSEFLESASLPTSNKSELFNSTLD